MQRNKHKEKAWIAVVRKHNYLISKLFKKKNICWSHLLQSNSSDRVQVSWSSQSTINRIRNKGLHILYIDLHPHEILILHVNQGKVLGFSHGNVLRGPCHAISIQDTTRKSNSNSNLTFLLLTLIYFVRELRNFLPVKKTTFSATKTANAILNPTNQMRKALLTSSKVSLRKTVP